MWIDFKLCSYFWFDNDACHRQTSRNVVNWFQIMFLFLVRQQTDGLKRIWSSCELISNYVLIFGSTTLTMLIQKYIQLWIDFKLCSYFWFDNRRRKWNGKIHGCELISNYVLIFGSTTEKKARPTDVTLWIDFKLCSYFWFDNWATKFCRKVLVVNWFQIMFLFLVRQLGVK